MDRRPTPAARKTDQPSTAAVLDLEERTWLPAHLRGDPAAFPRLVRSYSSLIYSFLSRYSVPDHARDDLFQEIFLKIHLAAATYRPEQPLRPWLITVALNTIRNARRGWGREPPREALGEPVSTTPDTGQQLDQEHRREQVAKLISTLPDTQREAICLFTLRGLAIADIARVLQVPENTAKTLIRRARLVLAEQVARGVNP